MNAGFMGKGIITHDCLVRLDHHAGNAAYKPACGIYLFAYNMRINIQSIFPSPEYHCYFFKGCIACPFSNPVYGARQVEGTINGIGERAGNASLEEIAMILRTRKDALNIDTHIISEQIYPTSRLVSSITGMMVQPNKAIVGDNAFAHESGIHQDGLLKEKTTYEIIRP